jgi:Bacteriophage Mu, GemA protein
MKKSPNKLQKQRNGLLAIVHIAKKSLGLDDDMYRDVLGNWGVKSSGAMSIRELEELVDHFQGLGFRVVGKRPKVKGQSGQIEALRDRIRAETLLLENGEERMIGLVKSKAGVESLEWVRSAPKLMQILRILKIFREQDAQQVQDERRKAKG